MSSRSGARSRRPARGAISQRPLLGAAEQRGKARVGIEARPAQPVDRAVARHQRGRFAVPDQRVISNADSHRSSQPEVDDEVNYGWHGSYCQF